MKKVVIFGQNRSGTKFLTNLTATSFDLSCVQSGEHGGVIESNIHAYYANNFPGVLDRKEKDKILDSFVNEFTFTKSKLTRSDLYKLKWSNCLDFFNKFYSKNADILNKKGWVQKVSSIYLDNFIDEDMLMIIIQRDSLNVLNSSIKIFKLNFSRSIRKLFTINLMHKYEKHFAISNSVLLLNYEDLLQIPEICINQISDLIDTNPLDYSGKSDFNNSSFKHRVKPKINLILKLFNIFFKLIIYFVPINLIKRRIRQNIGRKKGKLVANSIDTRSLKQNEN